MSDLLERLQQAVGATYRVERELGGGGMARVFLAEETRLGRKVVIKILPPEMAAGVSAERFEREIQVAARLQHPHIVPLLTAGADGDLLYYVMPFIAGESLRAKLAREGELPIPDALRILREVLDALQYAHGEGVVHRDIKPDNVLLSGHHAVVTDFGVAKAVSASTGEASLTSVGIALGTPAYMAPEQAAAEPSVDHRADVYAVGALAYEMLSGRPPFTATTLQGLLAAQITQAPEPLSLHRSTVPAALNELVMRCLHKKPADRWQHAEEILPHLDAMLTPTMGLTPTGTQPIVSSGTAAAIQRAHPLRVAGITALAAIGVLAIVYALVQVLGLPDWVFTGAIGLSAIGVPLLLLTGHHERRRAIARSTGRLTATPPAGASRHFTWRKAVLGSAAGFAGLALVVAGFMAMRSLGIGPAATLMTRGVLTPEDTLLLVAEFADNAGDSALAAAVTAAVRIDFAQSETFSLLSPQMIEVGLGLMRRERGTPLTDDVARELAQRVNLKALVIGEVSRLGNSHVFSASLISPATGEVFAAVRETAGGEDEVVNAVDRIAKGLRERIGESLRSIRASQPLRFATTESLDALIAYTQSWDAAEQGESEREIALLEEAVALDSSFAAAYRRLAVARGNSGSDPARARWAATKAFDLRERLPERERLTVTAYYYLEVDYDPSKAIAAQRAILEKWPFNGPATNNLALLYNRLRRWRDAEATVAPSIDSGVTYWTQVNQLLIARAAMGDRAGVERALNTLAQRAPGSLWLRFFRAEQGGAWGDYGAADSALAELERLAPATGPWGLRQVDIRYHLALVRGHLRDAERSARRGMQLSDGVNAAELVVYALRLATQLHVLSGDSARARAVADSALARDDVQALNPENRPYFAEVRWHALSGDVAAAERVYRDYDAGVPAMVQKGQPSRHAARAAIARARGELDQAIAAYRQANAEAWDCEHCWLWELGQVYEEADQPDSALAAYQRAVSTPSLLRVYQESLWRGPALKRLGELHEQRGEREKAVEYYGEFVDLWKDADPELQPLVEDVRARIARLVREES